MRATRTPDEELAIDYLRSFLEKGQSIVDDGSITDKPDWVFLLNKKRVALECSLLGIEKVFEWSNYKGKILGKNYKITYYFEPHLWVQKILEKKNGLASGYKTRAEADQTWLLIHSEKQPSFEWNSTASLLMQCGINLVGSNFDEIWFCHPRFGIVKIWEKSCQLPEVKVDTSRFDSPQCTIIQGNHIFTKDGLKIDISNIFEEINLSPLKDSNRV